MLDQRASILDADATIVDNFKRLNPGTTDNACSARLTIFLFRADSGGSSSFPENLYLSKERIHRAIDP